MKVDATPVWVSRLILETACFHIVVFTYVRRSDNTEDRRADVTWFFVCVGAGNLRAPTPLAALISCLSPIFGYPHGHDFILELPRIAEYRNAAGCQAVAATSRSVTHEAPH